MTMATREAQYVAFRRLPARSGREFVEPLEGTTASLASPGAARNAVDSADIASNGGALSTWQSNSAAACDAVSAPRQLSKPTPSTVAIQRA